MRKMDVKTIRILSIAMAVMVMVSMAGDARLNVDTDKLYFNASPASMNYGLRIESDSIMQYFAKPVPNDLSDVSSSGPPTRILDNDGAPVDWAGLDMGFFQPPTPNITLPISGTTVGGVTSLNVSGIIDVDDPSPGSFFVLFEYSLNSTTGMNGTWEKCIPELATLNPATMDASGNATMKWQTMPAVGTATNVWVRARAFRRSSPGNPVPPLSGIYSMPHTWPMWAAVVDVNNVNFVAGPSASIDLVPYLTGTAREQRFRVVVTTDEPCTSVSITANVNGTPETPTLTNPSGDKVTWIGFLNGSATNITFTFNGVNESGYTGHTITFHDTAGAHQETENFTPPVFSVTSPASVTANSWVMAGLPIIPSPSGVLTQLSEVANPNLEIWRVIGNYGTNYPFENAPSLSAGEGYWMRPEKTAPVTVSGFQIKERARYHYFDGSSLTSYYQDQSFEYPLYPGWNLVSLPYNFNVDMADIRVNSGGTLYTLALAHSHNVMDPVFWSWSGTQYSEYSSMVPWRSYFVKSFTTCTLIAPPVKMTAAPAPLRGPLADSSENWRIQMELTGAGGMADRRNFIGLLDADSGGLLHTEPPPSFSDNYVSMCFPHTDGNRYAYDIKPYRNQAVGGSAFVWEMLTETNMSQSSLTINWNGVSAVQGVSSMKLMKHNGTDYVEVADMRSTTSYTFTCAEAVLEDGYYIARDLFRVILETDNDIYPPAFFGLQAVAPTANLGEAFLQWKAGLDLEGSNPLKYRVYSAASSSSFNFGAPVTETSNLNVTLNGYVPGNTYYFIVRAVDAQGNEDTNTRILKLEMPSAADSTKPAIASRNPVNGATGVSLTSSIELIFSESLRYEDVVAANIYITQGVTGVNGSVAYMPSSNKAVIKPTVPFSPSTVYTVNVGNLRDLAGNVITSTTWSFTTEAARVANGGITVTGRAVGGERVYVYASSYTRDIYSAQVSGSGFYVINYPKNVAAGDILYIWLDDSDYYGRMAHYIRGDEIDSGAIKLSIAKTSYQKGLNLVALPYKPLNPMFAGDLVDQLTKTQGNTPALIHFDPQYQSFSVITGDTGLGFELTGDEGFLADLPEAVTVTWGGQYIEAGGTRDIQLYQNMNVVPAAGLIAASDFCDAFSVGMLTHYNNSSGRFEGYIKGVSTAFNCQPGFGYFINSTSTRTATLQLSSAKDNGLPVFMVACPTPFSVTNERTGQQCSSDGSYAAILVDIRSSQAVKVGDRLSVLFKNGSEHIYIVSSQDIDKGYIAVMP